MRSSRKLKILDAGSIMGGGLHKQKGGKKGGAPAQPGEQLIGSSTAFSTREGEPGCEAGPPPHRLLVVIFLSGQDWKKQITKENNSLGPKWTQT
jgi:hypothetical protein